MVSYNNEYIMFFFACLAERFNILQRYKKAGKRKDSEDEYELRLPEDHPKHVPR